MRCIGGAGPRAHRLMAGDVRRRGGSTRGLGAAGPAACGFRVWGPARRWQPKAGARVWVAAYKGVGDGQPWGPVKGR